MSNLRAWLAEKSSEEKEHFLGEVPHLFLEGRQVKKLCRLLSDFDFIEAKINHPEFGVQALIEDYDLIEDAELSTHPEYDAQTIEALKLIQGALRLSAHILNQDTKQLAGQLSGRLLDFDAPGIQGLLQQISQTKTTCLRTLTASLTPPGGALVRTLSGHSNSVSAVAVTSDGKYVISASDDKTLKVWDLHSGEEKFTLGGHSEWVNVAAVSGDGKYVISRLPRDYTLKVWDLHSGEEKFTLRGHRSWVHAAAVTGDSKYVISASADHTLKVWDLHSGEEKFTLGGHSSSVNAVAVTDDGKYVISGSDDDTLKVWDLHSGEEKFTLRGHRSSVDAVAVTGDSKYVISGSGETLKVWDLQSGQEIACFTGESEIKCCAVAPDSVTIVAGEASGRLHFLRLEGVEV